MTREEKIELAIQMVLEMSEEQVEKVMLELKNANLL